MVTPAQQQHIQDQHNLWLQGLQNLQPSPADIAGGGTGTPRFNTGGGDFLTSLYQARPYFVAQQGNLLSSLGGPLRDAIFAASPELAQASSFLKGSFEKPIPDDMQANYRDQLRQAQAARGFAGGAGSNEIGDEAKFLTVLGENRRQALLPQLTQFGGQMLGQAGLNPLDLNFASFASAYNQQGQLALQQQEFQAQLQAGQQQSQFAQQQFEWLKQQQQAFNQQQAGNRTYTNVSGGGVYSPAWGGSGAAPFGGRGGGVSVGGGGVQPGVWGASGNQGYQSYDEYGHAQTGPDWMRPQSMGNLSLYSSNVGARQASQPAAGNAGGSAYDQWLASLRRLQEKEDNGGWAGTGKSYAELHPAGAGFGGW